MKVWELFENKVAKGDKYDSFASWKKALKKKHPKYWVQDVDDFGHELPIFKAMVGDRLRKTDRREVGEWDHKKEVGTVF